MVEFKRDFGSFHSSNIEEIIQADDSVYKTPEHSVKFELNQYLLYDMTMMFGSKQLKKSLFFLDDEFNFLNHGAFGLSFKPVMQYTNEWRNYAESQPLRFYDRQIIPLLGDLIRLYSKQVFDCRAEELVLVENCTFAFNSIVNSIELNGNDKILIFNTTYGVYKKILKNKCRQNGADLIEIEINFPLLNTKDFNEQIIEPFCAVLEKEKSIKYIFVDHIPSNQPFLMPVSQLSEICKLKNPEIIFICDAAHSLGSVKDFSLKKLNNVDLAFMNCHKWFCGPKGTAFLYKNTSTKFVLKPAVQSHGINSGFHSEFIWTGLRDYSSYLGLFATLKIWNECLGGLSMAIDYCTNLARSSSDYLKNQWSTNYLVAPDFCATMICVKLPQKFLDYVLENRLDQSLCYDHAEKVQNYLFFKHQIEIPIKCIKNNLYVRISCHVYNNNDDFKLLAQTVLDKC